jgi:hypothetical protein
VETFRQELRLLLHALRAASPGHVELATGVLFRPRAAAAMAQLRSTGTDVSLRLTGSGAPLVEAAASRSHPCSETSTSGGQLVPGGSGRLGSSRRSCTSKAGQPIPMGIWQQPTPVHRPSVTDSVVALSGDVPGQNDAHPLMVMLLRPGLAPLSCASTSQPPTTTSSLASSFSP